MMQVCELTKRRREMQMWEFVCRQPWDYRCRLVRTMARMHRDPAWNQPAR